MFNYLFPIFCFGLVITGIVFLGILEAASQAKAESASGREPEFRNGKLKTSSPRSQPTRFVAPSFND